jgi:hypothetical protein
MASIALAGMLVQAPSLRSFDSGSQVCCFCVADRAYVRPRKGEEDAPGQFYDVEVWGREYDLDGICGDVRREDPKASPPLFCCNFCMVMRLAMAGLPLD